MTVTYEYYKGADQPMPPLTQFWSALSLLALQKHPTYQTWRLNLTHLSLASFLWDILANSAKPDQTPQNAASDQVLHCLPTEVSFFLK